MSELADRLAGHVRQLAGAIGPRNIGHPQAYAAARSYVVDQFRDAGLKPRVLPYRLGDGVEVANVEATIAGRSPRIVVIGAHYDSCFDTPGADDNASAVAMLLELARHAADQRPRHTLRFVAFANEEPPFFGGPKMGSWVCAEALRRQVDAGEADVAGMLCLEMVGYFTPERGGQPYPEELPAAARWLLPSRGDFLALVSDPKSAWWTLRLRRAVGVRQPGDLPRVPIWALSPPLSWTGGAHMLSDHWCFDQWGFKAAMLTDTAFVRNPHYHRATDTPDTLDYPRMARATDRIARAIVRL